MSLYNMVFGVNPHARALLDMIGIHPTAVPRLRDCFADNDGHIVVMTRTGGGNRSFYDKIDNRPEGAVNDDLRQSPYFVDDEDCRFDPTFAVFRFNVPPEHAEMYQWCTAHGATMDVEQRWTDFLAATEHGQSNPQLDRAAKGLKKALKGSGILD